MGISFVGVAVEIITSRSYKSEGFKIFKHQIYKIEIVEKLLAVVKLLMPFQVRGCGNIFIMNSAIMGNMLKYETRIAFSKLLLVEA